jgi:hypothetical protein
MSIFEVLGPKVRRELPEIGWTKARELAKLARSEGKHFDCAPWVHKARILPREEFQREVERALNGRETEPWEILCFTISLPYRMLEQRPSWCGQSDRNRTRR